MLGGIGKVHDPDERRRLRGRIESIDAVVFGCDEDEVADTIAGDTDCRHE